MKRSTIALSIGALLAGGQTALAQDMPSAEEMWRIIQEQQKQIEELKQEVKETGAKTDAVVEATESAIQGGAASPGQRTALGQQHSPFEHGGSGRTVLGGYGELHYNNLEGNGGAGDKDEIDLHRAILFLGHEFNNDIRFFSEIEYEHADDSKNGEVKIEQAYLEFDLNDRTRARAGMLLVPAGILNETHEPPAFYGVERNPVETNIIPTTWGVGGAGLNGQLGRGFSYDLAVHEGLNTTLANNTNYAVRAGRQNVSEAVARDPAFTGRLKWTGMPGVELAATLQHQTDITQGTDSTAGSASLFETHGIINRGPFTLKALYAMWDLEGSGPASVGADEQLGWYVEPSYKLTDKLGLFARYNQWDNQAGDNSSQSEKSQIDFGVNYWPHPDVVLKADYQVQDNDDGAEQDGFNLGVGYQF